MPIWVSHGYLEAGAIIEHMRSQRDRPQEMHVRGTTVETVEMAGHYCSRDTARQIVESQVRRPLYDALMNLGPSLAIAMEAPLLTWEDENRTPPSFALKPNLSVADAYHSYIVRRCGYLAAEGHAAMITRLAQSSLDVEVLRQRLEYLARFRSYGIVHELLQREHQFRFDIPAEETEQDQENAPN